MKLAAHITFFFVESRVKYLRQVVDHLNALPHQVTIFIYTNRDLSAFFSQNNIVYKKYAYRKSGVLGYNDGIWNTLGLTRFVHPYYLTWENRKVVQEVITEFDAQMYLEDDIAFTAANMEYWVTQKDVCLRHHYNLGFLRVEYDDHNKTLLTDLFDWPTRKIEIEGQLFLLNDSSSYCGFWIYDREELQCFIKTKEWKFDFKGLGIREKSAIGWHGFMMNHYQGTLLPMVKDADGGLGLAGGCTVHHIPNTYINDPVHCQIELPRRIG
jgi:hypothetical protein